MRDICDIYRLCIRYILLWNHNFLRIAYKLFNQPDQHFTLEADGVTLTCERLQLPGYTAFHVAFSSKGKIGFMIIVQFIIACASLRILRISVWMRTFEVSLRTRYVWESCQSFSVPLFSARSLFIYSTLCITTIGWQGLRAVWMHEKIRRLL